ncbi:hypothetical protein [Prevotella corporis]|uniref:hypothetical protein n=1 Tax=Prevotella corporis TaxID=28128 RepID=UPI0003FF32EA|nr:hypothetical protein [Prevotella corporis]MDQ7735918.1 hypothetical protein [Prevotella corporis]
MKPILSDYYKIFLSCPVGAMMQAAQRRMLENVKLWAEKEYTEQATFDDVRDFLESCQDAPVLTEFIEKVMQPLIDEESTKGETTVSDYLEYLREEDRVDE